MTWDCNNQKDYKDKIKWLIKYGQAQPMEIMA